MNNTKNRAPAISINGKQYCINIGRDVIRKLGFPSHVCILQNYRKNAIAIMPCEETEVLSFRVPDGFTTDRMKKFRIYSQALVEEILSNNDLEAGCIYSLKGQHEPDANAVIFYLSEIKGISNEDKIST